MPTATLTDVYNRSVLGPKNGLKPADAPPPSRPTPPIELDYPHVATQAEYAVEADKLNRFARECAEAEARLKDLHYQLAQASKPASRTEEDAISKAESLLTGEEHGVNLQAEIQATSKLIDALRNAQTAQHTKIRQVNQNLSRAAGRRYEEEHKKRVMRIMAALDELYAADQSEWALRNDLVRLGYDEGALPAMNFRGVEDPHDACGNLTFYWRREAVNYTKSAEQIASEVRKKRLAALEQS